SEEKLAPLYEAWGVDASRAIPVVGDIAKPNLGLRAADRKHFARKIDHLFHLAAIYDLNAGAEAQVAVNVEGTRNLVGFANAIGAGCLHHVSSIAAAGLYEGVFREDMFDEAEELEHPYFATKHDSEGIVRHEAKVPFRVYRPG